MKKINPWMIITIILIIIIILMFSWNKISGLIVIQTPQSIADNAMNYINSNLVSPNTTATFLSVSELKDLYNISFTYQGQNLSIFVTKDGSYIFLSQPLSMNEKPPQAATPQTTIGEFIIDNVSGVCNDEDKPIVYFFGSQKCPHCMWEDPIIENVTDKFKTQISFHENIDTDKDQDVLLKYSPRGYIPLIAIGCKYYRIGSGESFGEDNEAKILTSLICMITNNKPLSVCATVEDILNQIK